MFIFALLQMGSLSQAQKKCELSAGFGIPELFNLGVVCGQKVQYGAKLELLGPISWYGDDFFDWSIAAEVRYRFAGKSKFVDQAPWYVSGDLVLHDLSLMTLGGYYYEKYGLSLNPRIGRTFNLSEQTGLNMDVGLFIPLRNRLNEHGLDFKVFFSWSLSLFIRT